MIASWPASAITWAEAWTLSVNVVDNALTCPVILMMYCFQVDLNSLEDYIVI